MDDKPIYPAEDADLVPDENQTEHAYPNSDPESESDTESLTEASMYVSKQRMSLLPVSTPILRDQLNSKYTKRKP
jgi:hypothetical protein